MDIEADVAGRADVAGFADLGHDPVGIVDLAVAVGEEAVGLGAVNLPDVLAGQFGRPIQA